MRRVAADGAGLSDAWHWGWQLCPSCQGRDGGCTFLFRKQHGKYFPSGVVRLIYLPLDVFFQKRKREKKTFSWQVFGTANDQLPSPSSIGTEGDL